MKKFLFVLVSLVVSISCFAQWIETNIPKDDFKGTKECIAYTFKSNVGAFTYWSNKDGQYRLQTFDGQFNYKEVSGYGMRYCGITVKVGLFDETGKMLEKFDMWLDCNSGDGAVTIAETRDRGGMFNPVGQGKKVKKIMKHLNEKRGYVRFFVDLYGDKEFDFKVECKNNK